MTVWCDVEDLFDYARNNARPSGIQRLSYELYAALRRMAAQEVGFVRHDAVAGTMRVIDWTDVEALYGRMAEAPLRPPVPLAAAPRPLSRGALRSVVARVPAELRQPLGQAVRSQLATVRHLAGAVRASAGLLSARQAAEAAPDVAFTIAGRDLREAARPGDVIATLGSPWSHPDYASLIRAVSQQASLRFALLVYDLIPVLRPEFCDQGLVTVFGDFMRRCLPLADMVFAISQATVRDIETWAARDGLRLRAAPQAIPIGSGFSQAADPAPLPASLSPGGYALFVSTMEARKNHVLTFRAWRRLLDEMPAEQVPVLVFAGRVGWMVADLMQQIRNARHLDGKLVIVEDPGDAALAALYRGARFTLFPSHYEGWGLPVSESLAFGKACLASASTSIPEAGGPFCLYHDPDCVTEAVALYRRAIEEPGLIAGLESRLAAEYRAVPWSDSAAALLRGLL
ncbi:glycosyltransferase family 4 protein, partial [Paracraurococcus lichenis]